MDLILSFQKDLAPGIAKGLLVKHFLIPSVDLELKRQLLEWIVSLLFIAFMRDDIAYRNERMCHRMPLIGLGLRWVAPGAGFVSYILDIRLSVLENTCWKRFVDIGNSGARRWLSMTPGQILGGAEVASEANRYR